MSTKKKKQTIMKVDIDCQKCQTDIIAAVGKLKGVQSLHVDENKKTITIIGNVEPVPIYKALKKIKKNPEILAVRPSNSSNNNSSSFFNNQRNNNAAYISNDDNRHYSSDNYNNSYDPYYQNQYNWPPPAPPVLLPYRTEYRAVVPVDAYYYGESDGPGFCSIM